MHKLGAKTVFLWIFLISVFFAFFLAAPTGLARSTAVCRHDLSDAANKDTVFCPTDQVSGFSGCGDGITDVGEECDDGLSNGTNDLPYLSWGIDAGACVIDSTNSVSSCKGNYCGDGYLWSLASGGSEECDDGNLENGDGCTSSCTILLVPGDILSVEITRITNEGGTDTALFSRANTMTVEATVTNNTPNAISGAITFSIIKPGNVAAEILIAGPLPFNVTFPGKNLANPSGKSIQPPGKYAFTWSTAPPEATNGTFLVKASVPIPLDDISPNNNYDSYYITLGEAVNNNVSVPETNLLFLPVIGFAVISLIYYSSMAK